MRYGYRRSLPNIAGMQLGVALQLIVVGIGLGALIAASMLAFNLVKGFGVVYLCYLGWQQFRAEARPLQLADAEPAAGTAARAVRAGLPGKREQSQGHDLPAGGAAAVHRCARAGAAAVPHLHGDAHRGRCRSS